jgi:hypothetical protein
MRHFRAALRFPFALVQASGAASFDHTLSVARLHAIDTLRSPTSTCMHIVYEQCIASTKLVITDAKPLCKNQLYVSGPHRAPIGAPAKEKINTTPQCQIPAQRRKRVARFVRDQQPLRREGQHGAVGCYVASYSAESKHLAHVESTQTAATAGITATRN